MVSTLSLSAMAISAALSIFVPIGLFIYYRRNQQISYKVTGAGILSFVVFAMILERILHAYVFNFNPVTGQWLTNTTIFVLYGSLAAGIFEEGGRFLFFRYLLTKRRSYRDGLAFGIGHGGIESIIIGGSASLQNIAFALSLNAGTLDQSIGNTLSPEFLISIKTALLSTSPLLFLTGGLERIIALVMHIALSLLVLYGVRQAQFRYVLLAVGIHAIFNIPAALYQKEALGLPIAEMLMAIMAMGLLFMLRKGKTYFSEE